MIVSLENRMAIHSPVRALVVACIAVASLPAPAQPAPEGNSDAELAKKLQNPIAALISVPFQLTYDEVLGATR